MPSDATGEDTPAEVIARCGEKIGDACSADLTALLGRPVQLAASGVRRISADRVVGDDSPILHQLCRASGQLETDVHVLIPRPEAARLAALQLGNEDDPPDAALDAEACAAVQVVDKVLVGALENVLREEGVETNIETRDAREIPEPASDPTWLTGEHFQGIRFDLAVDRLPDGRIDLLFALEGGAADANAPGCTILFVVDRDAERESLEELAEALGWPVSVAPADRLDDGSVEAAGAIVIPWLVGGRSGLELVERLAGSGGERAPVLMSSEAPTRPMVSAALRAGAASFVMRPYSGEELRRRIREARAEPDAGAGDESPPEEVSGKPAEAAPEGAPDEEAPARANA